MAIVDTHCHLDFPAFDDDRDSVIRRAATAGVVGLVLIGINPSSWRSTENLASTYRGIHRSAGVHPNDVRESWTPEIGAALAREAAGAGLVAIGETGIDLYRSADAHELQIDAFQYQLELARAHELPVVIHQRNAEQQVLDVLRRHGGADGVMHCFGGDWTFAKQCLDVGLSLGIGGVATFPRSHDVRDAIARAPEDRLILETDAPYLAPQPHRGKRNEPAFLRAVVETIASCRSSSPEEIEDVTTRNATQLFRLDFGSNHLEA